MAPFDKRRVHRLTEAGRIAALGGRDPEAAWTTVWDYRWRLFLFDIPQTDNALRRKLTRSLSAIGCGCLQGSVWISATRPPGIEVAFPETGRDCSHLIISPNRCEIASLAAKSPNMPVRQEKLPRGRRGRPRWKCSGGACSSIPSRASGFEGGSVE